MKLDPRKSDMRRTEFEALYAVHSRDVWALAYARWMDADSAQDIMQEVFLRFWKQLEARDTTAAILNPRAWLLRVARNLAEDYAKSSFRRNGTQPPEMLGGLPDREDGPLAKMEREESFRQIRGILDELATVDREILTLRYAFDYETAAIAEILGVAPSAVHMRLSRARQRLAERFSAAGVKPNP
jgi:RNA polymerase sigma-70 factor (ECF subfamily)